MVMDVDDAYERLGQVKLMDWMQEDRDDRCWWREGKLDKVWQGMP